MPAHSKRTPEIEQAILGQLRSGVPLAQICRDDGMITSETWRNWCDADESLAIAYARARDDGFDAIASECLDIADETGNDTIRTKDGERANSEWITRSRLRVETRLKLLAKWDPKRYGERLDHTSSDGSMTPRTLADFYGERPKAKPDAAAQPES